MNICPTGSFERDVKSVKDKLLKERIKKQIKKLLENPEKGKPLKYALKGERAIYIRPYHLAYAFKDDGLKLLRLRHRDEVY